jgi:hypothetical protein
LDQRQGSENDYRPSLNDEEDNLPPKVRIIVCIGHFYQPQREWHDNRPVVSTGRDYMLRF